MIIEFTGCTGAGKSTISRRVVEKLNQQGIKVGTVHPDILNECPFICENFANVSSQNIVTDIKVLPWLILSLKENLRFFIFFLRTLFKYSDSFGNAVKIFRSVIRKIGINRCLRNKKLDDWFVVVDEGVIHSAHNFLVHVNSKAEKSDIEHFSNLVPLPDVIVFVKSPLEVVQKRALSRKDKSPRIRDNEQALKFIDNACEMFELLMKSKRLLHRTIIVDCCDDQAATTEELADMVIGNVLNERHEYCLS